MTGELFPDSPYWGILPNPAEAVDIGARLLDEVSPQWWHNIQAEKIRMASCKSCVLGQLFGDYNTAIYALRLSENETLRYGFTAPPHTIEEDAERAKRLTKYWGELKEAWSAEVRKRHEKETA